MLTVQPVLATRVWACQTYVAYTFFMNAGIFPSHSDVQQTFISPPMSCAAHESQ